MKTRIGLSAGLLAVQLTFAAVQSPMDCHLFYDGANTVEIKSGAGGRSQATPNSICSLKA